MTRAKHRDKNKKKSLVMAVNIRHRKEEKKSVLSFLEIKVKPKDIQIRTFTRYNGATSRTTFATRCETLITCLGTNSWETSARCEKESHLRENAGGRI